MPMEILDQILDNDILFYGMFVGVVCHIGISFICSIQRSKKEITETGVQTDAGDNYSDKPSQIIQDNVTSIEALSPASPAFEGTSSVIPTTSEVGTQTIAEGTSSIIPTTSEVGTQTIAKDFLEKIKDPSYAEF